MSEFIPYARQQISETDIETVVEVLRSDWLTQGPAVPTFEEAVARKVGVRHAVAVNSATSALHIACLALGLKAGDHLWTVPNTFVASANCGRYCGAAVDFVDIDSQTWNLSADHLQKKLKAAHSGGCLPKILIPVHFAGLPTDQERIWELSQKYGFKIIEDASHSIGARQNGELVGNCRWSDITIFSFHPVKIITTGEGGIALTNDPELCKRMARLRTHGITRDPEQMTKEPNGSWYYEQLELGFNYRMTDMQAALGLSQLGRLEQFVARRNELAQRYDDALAELPVTRQLVSENTYSARHLYVIRIAARQHLKIFETLRQQGIGVNLHYLSVHLQPYYRSLGFQAGSFPEAEAHALEAISLPLYASLSNEQQDRVVDTVVRELA